jgi:hypothetical protein
MSAEFSDDVPEKSTQIATGFSKIAKLCMYVLGRASDRFMPCTCCLLTQLVCNRWLGSSSSSSSLSSSSLYYKVFGSL